MDPTILPSQRRLYYGWVIVGLGMISMAFWFGIRTTFSVFFVALLDQFRWGRAEAAGAQSIAMVIYMLMAPIIGTLVNRIGPRKVIVPGILLTASGLLLCTQIRSLFHFYLFSGVVVGMGVTCLSIAPFTVVLAHWFEKRRGTANGLAGVGIGLGLLLLVPFIQHLISLRGWQFAYLLFGFLVLLIPLPLNAIFLRHRPQEMGFLPDGDRMRIAFERHEGVSRDKAIHVSTWIKGKVPLREYLKTFRFWCALSYPALSASALYIIMVHNMRYLADLGVDRIWAASLLAGIGGLSAGFRFFWGWLSDRAGREATFTIGSILFFNRHSLAASLPIPPLYGPPLSLRRMLRCRMGGERPHVYVHYRRPL